MSSLHLLLLLVLNVFSIVFFFGGENTCFSASAASTVIKKNALLQLRKKNTLLQLSKNKNTASPEDHAVWETPPSTPTVGLLCVFI